MFIDQQLFSMCPTAAGPQQLRLVPGYVYLGTLTMGKGEMGPELARRAASALQAHASLSRRVFGKSDVSAKVKAKAAAACGQAAAVQRRDLAEVQAVQQSGGPQEDPDVQGQRR